MRVDADAPFVTAQQHVANLRFDRHLVAADLLEHEPPQLLKPHQTLFATAKHVTHPREDRKTMADIEKRTGCKELTSFRAAKA